MADSTIDGANSTAAADAARRAQEEAARAQQAQQAQQQQQQQQVQRAQQTQLAQKDGVDDPARRVDAARVTGASTPAATATDPVMPKGDDKPVGAVTDAVLLGAQEPAAKTGIDKAVADIQRVDANTTGELGSSQSALYNRSLDQSRQIVQQQIGRVRAGADLLVPDDTGSLRKTVPLDDQARAALTSSDPATQKAAVDRLAHAIEDKKEWNRMYGAGSVGNYTNVDGKTQQQWLQQLNKPDASAQDKAQALNALTRYSPGARAGDSQRAIDAATAAGNGRPTDPNEAKAWDKLSKTDPNSLSQSDLKIANAMLDKFPPMAASEQAPGTPARDLQDKLDQFRQAQTDVDDQYKRAGFSNDSDVVGTSPEASKALLDDVQGRIGTASPADAGRALQALDRLQQNPATAMPQADADALRKQLSDRQQKATGDLVNARLDQTFDKVLNQQNPAENLFDGAKNLFGSSSGSDAVRSSLSKLNDARKALDGSPEKKAAFDKAAQDAKDTLAGFEKSQGSLGERASGALRAAGGLVEAAIGAANAETGVGVAVAAHGLDNAQAGLRQAISGEPTQSLTETALSNTLQAAGVDPKSADFMASLGDTALSFAGPAATLKVAQARAALADRLPPVAPKTEPVTAPPASEPPKTVEPPSEPAPSAPSAPSTASNAPIIAEDGSVLTDNPQRRLAGKPDAQVNRPLTKEQAQSVVDKMRADQERLSQPGKQVPTDPPQKTRLGTQTDPLSNSEKLGAYQLMQSAGADSVTVGENNVRATLGLATDNSQKVSASDLLRTEKSGKLTPVEVKNTTEVDLTGTPSSALRKFSSMEDGAIKAGTADKIDHYEVITNDLSKMPNNYMTDSGGRLFHLDDGKWTPVGIGPNNKPVIIRRAYLGELGT